MNNMNNEDPQMIYDGQVRAGLKSFLTKMYLYMASAVALSALVAYLLVYQFPAVLYSLVQNQGLMWGIVIAQLVVIMLAGSGLRGGSPARSIISLYALAALEGFVFAMVALAYTTGVIALAFASASVTFICLAAFGTKTDKDLSAIGKQAFAALIALVIVTIINIFLKSAMITYVFSYISVIIFAGLTMWDAQKMKQIYLQNSGVNTTSLAAYGALSLYLDFINMFISLVQIFGGVSSSRD